MIELKKLKCYPQLREETECFTAQFWVDGKYIADIKNSGHGGCNDFSIRKGYTYEDVEKYTDIKTECEIFGMVIEMDETKLNQTKGFYLKKDGEYYKSKFPKPISKLKGSANYSAWLTVQLDNFRNQGFTVLNKNL